MVWATVNSRSCFCWLHRASPSLAANHIITMPYCIYLGGGGLVTTSCTMLPTTVHSSSDTLSTTSNVLNLFITSTVFDLGHISMAWYFPYFLQFKPELYSKKLMIWVTVSYRSWFCWLFRASPSLAAKNIISLIWVLTIWWCWCVEFFLVWSFQSVFAMTSVFSW